MVFFIPRLLMLLVVVMLLILMLLRQGVRRSHEQCENLLKIHLL
jgi:hypothetical protein